MKKLIGTVLCTLLAVAGCAVDADIPSDEASTSEGELTATSLARTYRLGAKTGRYSYERGALVYENGRLTELAFDTRGKRVRLKGSDAEALAALFAGVRAETVRSDDCEPLTFEPDFDAPSDDVLYFRLYRRGGSAQAFADDPAGAKGGYSIRTSVGADGLRQIGEIRLVAGNDNPRWGFDDMRYAHVRDAGRLERVSYGVVDVGPDATPIIRTRCLDFARGSLSIDWFSPSRPKTLTYRRGTKCAPQASGDEQILEGSVAGFEKDLCTSDAIAE